MSTSPKPHRLGVYLAAIALSASWQTPAIAALSSYCVQGAFSQATVGICGQIQGGGQATFGAYVPATFTVTGAPLQSGLSPVSASGVVAGTGVFGGVSAAGDFGQLHAFASAKDTNPRTNVNSSSVYTQGNASFVDGFTVGSADVETTVTVAVDGGVSVGASGDLYFNLFDVTPYQSGAVVQGADLEPITVNGINDGYKTYDLVFQAGHSYSFSLELVAEASASVDFLNYHTDSIADLSNTGTLDFDVVTPGESLTFLSGHDYSSNAVVTDPTGPTDPGSPVGSAVPEPSAVSLFFIGLAGLASVARRRSSQARRGFSWVSARLRGRYEQALAMA